MMVVAQFVIPNACEGSCGFPNRKISQSFTLLRNDTISVIISNCGTTRMIACYAGQDP